MVRFDKGQVDSLVREIAYRRRRDSLEHFVRWAFERLNPGTQYIQTWHVGCICEHVEAVVDGEIRNLIINIFPRSLKSTTVTVAAPAWILGKNPSEKIICGSYASTLALKHSVETRYLIETEEYQEMFLDTRIAFGQNEKSKFVTTRRGHRIATSVGGSVSGEGCRLMIIDDPHDPRRALSDVERVAANEVWLDQTMSTRFDSLKDSRTILVMQRLHTHDMTGHMLEKDLPGMVHLDLPTEAETRQVITFPKSGRNVERNVGDLLCPERLGRIELEQAKKSLGPYGYGAQHGQRPTPIGGGRIKLDWFPRVKRAERDGSRVVLSIDTGYKEADVNNPTAILVFSLQENTTQWVLVDSRSDRWAFPSLVNEVIGVAREWRPETILIENKASGISLLQWLVEKTHFPVVPVEPKGSKLIRMEECLSLLSAGRIALLESDNSPWLFRFRAALMQYPAPVLWDELDALSQFLNWLKKDEQFYGLALPVSVTGRREVLGTPVLQGGQG